MSIEEANSGRSLAVWSDDRTGDHDVYGMLLSASGAPLSPIGGFVIAGAPGTQEGDPHVAACGNTFLVVWGNGYTPGNTTDLFATRVSDSGVILDPTPIVISNQAQVQHNARKPTSDNADTFLVLFRTLALSPFGSINTMRVSASAGVILDPPGGVPLAPPFGAALQKNAVATFGAGKFLITWDDASNGCTYPGESGCADISAVFMDPTTGNQLGPRFSTTRAFSCQEGSWSAFNGTDFFVCHSDERVTNCITADFTAERVTPSGFVRDTVDATGRNGGIWIASDPAGFPGSIQSGTVIAADACSQVVAYRDYGVTGGNVAMRLRRVNRDGELELGDVPGDPGPLVHLGLPSPNVNVRMHGHEIGPHRYLTAYTMNNVVLTRVVQFTTPMRRLALDDNLNFPRGVAVNTAGDIVIADTDNHRIQVRDRRGSLRFVIGGQGAGPGRFLMPFGVAVDNRGDIVVLDTGNHRVQVFDQRGVFKFMFGSFGTTNGRFRYPLGIAVDAQRNIYVADTDNDRVQVFRADGTFKFKFGTTGTYVGQFHAARAAAVGLDGRIYVADRDNNRVQIFSPNGAFLSTIAGPLSAPRGVAVDAGNRLFVADSGRNRVVLFSAAAEVRYSFGTAGARLGEFRLPIAVAVDSSGSSYVADAQNNRVQVFGCVP